MFVLIVLGASMWKGYFCALHSIRYKRFSYCVLATHLVLWVCVCVCVYVLQTNVENDDEEFELSQSAPAPKFEEKYEYKSFF